MSEPVSIEPRWVDVAISRLLRTGVLLSIATILLGVVLMFVHHPAYFSSAPALGRLTEPGTVYPNTIAGVLRGVREGRGQAMVMLGLLFLIATPVARVALSIAVFVIERDRLYVAITILVLLLLTGAFISGAAG